MKNTLLILFVLTLLSCQQQQVQELPESEVIAVVGEEIITTDLLKAYLQTNGVANADEKTVNKALEKLIEEVAIANIAKKKKLPMTGEQLNALKYLQIRSMANNARTDYLLDNKITDGEIQQEYANANKQAGGIQFKVHHLLYKDEVEAIKTREKITSVESYKIIQQQFLAQNPNMRGVGDLGWVTLGQLPKSFREVLPVSEENSVLANVLNSEYGAHVVYLEGTRKLQPPKLADVKPGIINALKNKKLSKFSQLAKAKAKVMIKE